MVFKTASLVGFVNRRGIQRHILLRSHRKSKHIPTMATSTRSHRRNTHISRSGRKGGDGGENVYVAFLKSQFFAYYLIIQELIVRDLLLSVQYHRSVIAKYERTKFYLFCCTLLREAIVRLDTH